MLSYSSYKCKLTLLENVFLNILKRKFRKTNQETNWEVNHIYEENYKSLLVYKIYKESGFLNLTYFFVKITSKEKKLVIYEV